MKFIPFGTPKKMESLGILAYLIVSNKQVHSYQMEVFESYLKLLDLELEELMITRIIDGKEDAISFDEVLRAFEEEEVLIQRDLYYMLHVLAYIDHVIDLDERELIGKVERVFKTSSEDMECLKKTAIEDAFALWEEKNVLYEREWILFEKKGFWYKFFNRIRNGIRKIFGRNTTEQKNTNKYKRMIERCAVVAKEDFQIVAPAYRSVIDSSQVIIQELQETKGTISSENDVSAEVSNIVQVFAQNIDKQVLEQCKKAERSFVQKERTLSDFTISLIGRTKAGKSTLHAILTNQGYEKIGEGKQRTTRYNRVYQWNLLRLIDTPGIGSAEAAGRTDDEIAESVLGESDVICFVVVDDSILKDVLDFIEKVASLNKPIIILLNHKENIRPEVKYKHFIKNPMDWLENKGESRLQGHVDRIMKYANERGFGELVKVFPVFLLAAQMSNEKEYKRNRKLLWKSSNVDSFITQLKNWIAMAGTLKRSQTILDEAAGVLDSAVQKIDEARKPLLEQLKKLNLQKEKKVAALHTKKEETLKKIRAILKERFRVLACNKALEFAEEVYADKGDLGEHWNAYLRRTGFMELTKTEVNREVEKFVREAQEVVQELFEDVTYSVSMSTEVEEMTMKRLVDVKSIGIVAGSFISLVGSVLAFAFPIAGLIVGLTGAFVGIVSSFFESKEKKRQRKINKIYESVKKSIEERSPAQIEEAITKIGEGMESNIQDVANIYTNLIEGLSEVYELSNGMIDVCQTQVSKLNKAYAWRICQFLNGDEREILEETFEAEIQDVNRSTKGVIEIQTKLQVSAGGKRLEDIIVDKVKFT